MFYTDIAGDFVVMRIEPKLLVGEVKLEPAAAVGTKQHTRSASEMAELPLFPHLYGGIPLGSILEYSPVTRAADGTFLAIAADSDDAAAVMVEAESSEAVEAAATPLYVKIETAGHFSLTDRYKKKRERALTLAFVAEQLGLARGGK